MDRAVRSEGGVPFNQPYLGDAEIPYASDALRSAHRQGGGPFTQRCQAWLEAATGCSKALLTPSCTAALEMAALLLGVGPGDEVIMPSYTFVSTANAFVLRGATPVFVDIDPATQNIDPKAIEAAVTPRTKAIVPVHYAGIGCDMDAIMTIAERHRLYVVEDAAQGLMATYKGRALGSIGHLGALSFHDTKNTSCGEGGALLIRDPCLVERALVLWEKGTDRQRMLRGEIDKYTWVDVGSSFLPSDITAAVLLAQLEGAAEAAEDRCRTWATYHDAFEAAARIGIVARPIVPDECRHNGHLYYLILPGATARADFITRLRARNIGTPLHYVPLHSSPAGARFGRVNGSMRATVRAGTRLVRLPLWRAMPKEAVESVIAEVRAAIASLAGDDVVRVAPVGRPDRSGIDAPRVAAERVIEAAGS
jgi:dTDP-4-amino-4,6-dideoxygalactose transaminase